MSNAANIVVTDSVAASHTFSVRSKDQGYQRFMAGSGAIATQYRLAVKHTEPKSFDTESIVKDKLILTIPRLDTDGVSLTPLIATVTYDVPNGATDVEKADLYTLLNNIQANTLIEGQLSLSDPMV
jgi:hypothetical protein